MASSKKRIVIFSVSVVLAILLVLLLVAFGTGAFKKVVPNPGSINPPPLVPLPPRQVTIPDLEFLNYFVSKFRIFDTSVSRPLNKDEVNLLAGNRLSAEETIIGMVASLVSQSSPEREELKRKLGSVAIALQHNAAGELLQPALLYRNIATKYNAVMTALKVPATGLVLTELIIKPSEEECRGMLFTVLAKMAGLNIVNDKGIPAKDYQTNYKSRLTSALPQLVKVLTALQRKSADFNLYTMFDAASNFGNTVDAATTKSDLQVYNENRSDLHRCALHLWHELKKPSVAVINYESSIRARVIKLLNDFLHDKITFDNFIDTALNAVTGEKVKPLLFV